MKASMRQMTDRRSAPRMSDPALVVFYWNGAEPTPYRLRDISRTGAYMYTKDRWYLGTILQITIQIDSTETKASDVDASSTNSVTLWSKIVRSGEDGVGMAFLLLQRKRRESFLKLLGIVSAKGPEHERA